jgi:hypothetical protein
LTPMPAELPTKSPAALSAKDADSTVADETAEIKSPGDTTFDRFHPDMPRIPGVTGARPSSPPKSATADNRRLALILGAGAAGVVLMIAIVWWMKSAPREGADSAGAEAAQQESPAPKPPPLPALPLARSGPTPIATVAQLSRPWSSKKFVFVKPFPNENVDAMVIRLPGGALWAFALQEPYGRCELEFVTDTKQIATKYGYRASHPMVVNPCNSTVYDPLKVGPLGASTWARGEVVQGSGLRPPLSIDVVVHGRSVIADRME